MTIYEKTMLKYATGALLIVILTMIGGYIALFKEDVKVKTTLYKRENPSGRVIFYKKIGDEFYIVTKDEIELLIENGVEVVDK